jgi:asparagine synthase (glutamine-hydrolysing)
MAYFDIHKRSSILDKGHFFQVLVKDGRERSPSYIEEEGRSLWIDGEVYSQMSVSSFLDDLSLQKIRGYFSAVLFDQKSRSFSLITDRFGLKPLYLYQANGHIIWASEVKVLRQMGLPLTWDLNAVNAYLDLGYLPGDLTWYKEVTLLPPASRWTLRPDDRTWQKSQYWSWDDIPVLSMPFDQAVDETVSLLRQSIERRCKGRENLTLGLSGGLDSRTILALGKTDISTAFTFGLETGDDAILAKRCAAAEGLKHKMLVVDQDNWLNGRLDSVWRTEGMMPFFELHSAPVIGSLPELGDAVLNGFGGANYLGGLYDERSRLVGELRPYLTPASYEHPNLGHSAHIADHHMRRKVLQGSIDVGKALVQVKPYMDEDLLDHVMGLPIAYRRHYRLFFALIEKFYPQSLRNIPWETTGWPLKNTRFQSKALAMRWPSIRRRSGLKSPIFDYGLWVKEPGFMSMARALVDENTDLHDVLGRKARFDQGDLGKSGRLLSLAFWLKGKPDAT